MERLQERLYSPNEQPAFSEPSVRRQTPEPTQQWQQPPPPPPVEQKPPRKPISMAVWFLIGAILFALIALGASAYFILVGTRSVTSNNIDITVAVGQTTVASGTAVPLTITIKNRNPGAITNTSIEADFPESTRSASDVTQPYPLYTDTLGTIPAGGTVTRTVQAVFFGSANQTISIPITLQYQAQNSNEVLTKNVTSSITITSAPLTITSNVPSTIASGQPFRIVVAVHSNATEPLTNIAVVAQYPQGFIPQSSSATTTGPFFTIGTLQPGQEQDISITGTLTGTDADQRNFGFTVGTASSDGSHTLSVAYANTQGAITLSKPFLSAALSLNNSASDPLVVQENQIVNGNISWTNTLTTGLTNAQITVHFSGNALDLSNIRATNGYYSSSADSVIYTKDTEQSLAHLNSGDSGNGSFALGLKTGGAFAALRNPSVQISVGVAGTPDGASSAESIQTTFTRTIKVSTDLVLNSYLLHTSGPFIDNGAWPPIPDQPTQYTVMLSVQNDVNDVGGATVTMILPSYVTFTGKTNPNDGSLTYDDTTRTVTWKIGNVPAGTVPKPITAAFQISYLPSAAQSGTSPILVQSQSLTGVDRFTNATVGNTVAPLSTQATRDPSYTTAKGTVAN